MWTLSNPKIGLKYNLMRARTYYSVRVRFVLVCLAPLMRASDFVVIAVFLWWLRCALGNTLSIPSAHPAQPSPCPFGMNWYLKVSSNSFPKSTQMQTPWQFLDLSNSSSELYPKSYEPCVANRQWRHFKNARIGPEKRRSATLKSGGEGKMSRPLLISVEPTNGKRAKQSRERHQRAPLPELLWKVLSITFLESIWNTNFLHHANGLFIVNLFSWTTATCPSSCHKAPCIYVSIHLSIHIAGVDEVLEVFSRSKRHHEEATRAPCCTWHLPLSLSLSLWSYFLPHFFPLPTKLWMRLGLGLKPGGSGSSQRTGGNSWRDDEDVSWTDHQQYPGDRTGYGPTSEGLAGFRQKGNWW